MPKLLQVTGKSRFGVKCALDFGMHISKCKTCDCKKLLRYKTRVAPAKHWQQEGTSTQSDCSVWVLRATNPMETFFATTYRQNAMLKIREQCMSNATSSAPDVGRRKKKAARRKK